MTFPRPQESPDKQAWPLFLLLGVLGIVLPLITNYWLPSLKIFVFSDILTPESLCWAGFLLLGGIVYIAYFQFIIQRPAWLVVYSTVLIRPVMLLAQTIEKTGHHFPLRAIQTPLLVLPAALLFLTYLPGLSVHYRYFKYIIIFIAIYALYYLFFNYNFVDPTVAKVTGISISKGNITDYLFGFTSLIITGSMFLKAKTTEERFRLFELINRLLIIETIVESSLAIAGYPLGLFTMKVEGFRRTVGFLNHPNEFAKSEGLLLIYFIGLYYYYLKNKGGLSTRLTKLLLGVAIVLNTLSFLLSLSKNSFAGFAIACLIYLIPALLDENLRKRLIVPLIAVGGLLMLALGSYQAASGGKGIMTLITERFNDTRSLEWRTRVWSYLLANVNMRSIWTGHGLTTCNMEMYRFQYNAALPSEQQSIYVHNAFIQFIYDMGLSGLLIFSGIFSATFTAIRRYLSGINSPLYLTVGALSVFVIIGSLTDECITEMHMNMMYWFMITMIFSFLQSKVSNEHP